MFNSLKRHVVVYFKACSSVCSVEHYLQCLQRWALFAVLSIVCTVSRWPKHHLFCFLHQRWTFMTIAISWTSQICRFGNARLGKDQRSVLAVHYSIVPCSCQISFMNCPTRQFHKCQINIAEEIAKQSSVRLLHRMHFQRSVSNWMTEMKSSSSSSSEQQSGSGNWMTVMTAKGAKVAAGSDFLMEGFRQLKSSLAGNILLQKYSWVEENIFRQKYLREVHFYRNTLELRKIYLGRNTCTYTIAEIIFEAHRILNLSLCIYRDLAPYFDSLVEKLVR